MTAILQSPNSRLPDMDDGFTEHIRQKRRNRLLKSTLPMVDQGEINKKIAANYVNWREANIKTGIPPVYSKEAKERMARERDEISIEMMFSAK